MSFICSHGMVFHIFTCYGVSYVHMLWSFICSHAMVFHMFTCYSLSCVHILYVFHMFTSYRLSYVHMLWTFICSHDMVFHMFTCHNLLLDSNFCLINVYSHRQIDESNFSNIGCLSDPNMEIFDHISSSHEMCIMTFLLQVGAQHVLVSIFFSPYGSTRTKGTPISHATLWA